MAFRLIISTGEHASQATFDSHDADLLLGLLHNSSLHFVPDLLAEHLDFVIGQVANMSVFTKVLYERQVKALFDCLSLGMTPQLKELRYNLNSARVPEAEREEAHNLYYEAHCKALYVQSRLLPVVMRATIDHTPINIRHECW